MINNILIVGLGNIGKRHLESLMQKKEYQIYIYDEDKKKLNNIKFKSNLFKIENLIFLKKTLFKVCIISTTASNRLNLVKKIKKNTIVDHWIIEKPLEQSFNNLFQLSKIIKKDHGWINTPRRTFKFYKDLKNKIGKRIVFIELKGEIEIACNAIHFIDVMSYLIDSNVKNIFTDNLNNKWVRSSRKGFIEIYGQLVIEYKNGVIFLLNCKQKKNNFNKKNYSIRIYSDDNNVYEINETLGLLKINNKSKRKEILKNQSDITKIFVKDLIEKNKCLLPSIKDAISNHLIFTSALVKHYNQCYGKKLNIIKIS